MAISYTKQRTTVLQVIPASMIQRVTSRYGKDVKVFRLTLPLQRYNFHNTRMCFIAAIISFHFPNDQMLFLDRFIHSMHFIRCLEH